MSPFVYQRSRRRRRSVEMINLHRIRTFRRSCYFVVFGICCKEDQQRCLVIRTKDSPSARCPSIWSGRHKIELLWSTISSSIAGLIKALSTSSSVVYALRKRVKTRIVSDFNEWLWGLEPCVVLRLLPSRRSSFFSFLFHSIPPLSQFAQLLLLIYSVLFYSVLFYRFHFKTHRPHLILYKQAEACMYLDSSHTS